MDTWRTRQFLKLYLKPVQESLQFYIMIFIGVSFLSFATYLRDFHSVPLLLAQLLSPILVPILLYVVPSCLLSAGVYSHMATEQDFDIAKRIKSRLLSLNAFLPLLLSVIYSLIYIRSTEEELQAGNVGILFAILSVPSVLLGIMLGHYASDVAKQAMNPVKAKRKLKHELQDIANEDYSEYISEEQASNKEKHS